MVCRRLAHAQSATKIGDEILIDIYKHIHHPNCLINSKGRRAPLVLGFVGKGGIRVTKKHINHGFILHG